MKQLPAILTLLLYIVLGYMDFMNYFRIKDIDRTIQYLEKILLIEATLNKKNGVK